MDPFGIAELHEQSTPNEIFTAIFCHGVIYPIIFACRLDFVLTGTKIQKYLLPMLFWWCYM